MIQIFDYSRTKTKKSVPKKNQAKTTKKMTWEGLVDFSMAKDSAPPGA